MERTIITVLGKDRVGIIAAVCSCLAENQVNIMDITQTITGGFFNMMMIVDISASPLSFSEINTALKKVGTELGMHIKMQSEDIFDAMHRI